MADIFVAQSIRVPHTTPSPDYPSSSPLHLSFPLTTSTIPSLPSFISFPPLTSHPPLVQSPQLTPLPSHPFLPTFNPTPPPRPIPPSYIFPSVPHLHLTHATSLPPPIFPAYTYSPFPPSYTCPQFTAAHRHLRLSQSLLSFFYLPFSYTTSSPRPILTTLPLPPSIIALVIPLDAFLSSPPLTLPLVFPLSLSRRSALLAHRVTAPEMKVLGGKLT